MTKQRTYNPIDCHLRNKRYRKLRADMDYIDNHRSGKAALYQMMDVTIYADFETLISTTIEDLDNSNDNEKKY